VRKLASNPETVAKAKPIFAFLHEYESRYGDLVQIINLENRMAELFPDDPALHQFSHRYSIPAFDPTAFKPIVSPTQLRPKGYVAEARPISRHGSPGPRYMSPATLSPKRPFPTEDFEDDYSRPRKFMRAESPLKGAAGRRMDQQKRAQQSNGGDASGSSGPRGGGPSGTGGPGQTRGGGGGGAQPLPFPKEIMHLLSIIPPASTYDSIRFKPDKLVEILRQIDLPQSTMYGRQPAGSHGGYQGGRNY
jgi:cleavage stimulation factor subunit 3